MPPNATNVTQDFIFGTLATDHLRLAALQAEGRAVHHGNRIMPADPEPDQAVIATVSIGTEVNASAVLAFYTLDGSLPTPQSASITFVPGEVVWDTLLWGYRHEWHATFPPQPAGTHVRYRVVAYAHDGTHTWADRDPTTQQAATFAYHVDRERVPQWLREAVIYHIFVDRFYPGAGRNWNTASDLGGFWGGTLRGVIDQLPYLQQLGIDAIWLSPVFPSPTHHGYDATDYLHVEPRLGTDDDLRALFAAAHALGMRVLLDFVASHVSNHHPAFVAATHDRSVPQHTWFTFTNWPDEYRSFFGVRSMPQLQTDDPGARAYLIESAQYWLAQGADGFRLDYANGPSHGFWTQFRADTRAIKADSCTLGEIVETAELQRSYAGRLDGTLDFLLLQHLRAFLGFQTITTSAFDSFLRRHLAFFSTDFVLPSFLDNHDMNRFLWIVGNDTRRLKLAALCQFSLPHPPIIYYGTEVGLSQHHDLEYPDGSRRPEESRTLMLWNDTQDHDLLAFYQQLIALRRRYAEAWQKKRQAIVIDDAGLYVVALAHGTDQIVVALNRTAAEQHVALSDPTLLLATDPLVTLHGNTATLPPFGGALLIQPRA